MGGWGSNGLAVDAGFQHGTTNHDWAPMLQINGHAYGQTARLSEKQNVFFKFWVPSDNNVSMYIAGIDKSTGVQITRTYVYSANGFSNAGGNILKRMTTIAQKGTENLSSGSWVNNVHWFNTYIGTSSTSNHAWSSTDQATDQYNGYQSYKSSNVNVNFINAGEETDNVHT